MTGQGKTACPIDLALLQRFSPHSDLPPPPSDPVAPATGTTVTVEEAAVDRQSSTTVSTAAGSTSTVANTSTDGSGQFQGTVRNPDVTNAELEKRRNRASRFGIPLQEQDKAIQRAARFGVPVNASVTASLTETSGTTSTTPLKPVPAKPGSVQVSCD